MPHSHHHHDHADVTGVKLIVTIIMNFTITAAEIIGGLLSGSLSLVSDALHNLSDGIAVIISYISLKLGKVNPSGKHTFGYKRAEILAASFNASVLVIVSIYLFYKAAGRFIHPVKIEGTMMFIVAGIGLSANLISTLLLRSHASDNINIKSAYLHLLSDSISSAGVIVGGLLIKFFNLYWIDPLLTVVIGIYIIIEAVKIFLDTTHILMEGTPSGVDPDEIERKVTSLPDVLGVHHLHVWSVSEKSVALEAHITVKDMMISRAEDVLSKVEELLEKEFGINHSTLQLESKRHSGQSLINIPENHNDEQEHDDGKKHEHEDSHSE